MSSTLTEQTQTSTPLSSGKLEVTPSTTPRNVETILNFFKDNEDGSPPEPNYVGQTTSFDRPVDARNTTVYDVRGAEDTYTLDTRGFQFIKHASQEKEFLDEEKITTKYYAEVEELLKSVTGASKIFIFDHTIRREAIDSRAPRNPNSPAPLVIRGPVQRVHVDQSYGAVPRRIEHHLPAEASELLKGRYQLINVWRPISTILKDPLGVADATTVDDADLVPIKLIYPDREGETYSVRGNPAQKWHYLFKQTPEEPLLIKCFDSKVDGRARRVPHSSFVDAEFEGERKRESIEVRALVFHEHDRE